MGPLSCSLIMKEPSITPKTEIIMGPMTPAERNRWKSLKEELASQLDIINTAFIKAGRILRQIRDERLYREEYDTFEKFCGSMVGKDKRYVNRIIQAHDVIDELLLGGVKETDLPNNERICRELANYPMPDMKKIWQRAKQLSLAAGKSHPDSITVREAAATIEGDPKARRRQIAELLQRFERIARALKLTIGWGDMEPREIERLRKALTQIAAATATHLEGIPKEFTAAP
jgi:hypothetical protein